jgi:biopolymer transport protein ExbD
MDGLRRSGGSFRALIEADIEILPLMNLFIVLIPMLLLSAVFIEVTAVDMTLPGEASAESDKAETPSLDLSVLVASDAYVVRGTGIRTRTISRSEDGADAALVEVIAEIARAHPDEKSVRILSTPTTRYGEIIAVMDISREAGLPHAGLAAAEASTTDLGGIAG